MSQRERESVSHEAGVAGAMLPSLRREGKSDARKEVKIREMVGLFADEALTVDTFCFAMRVRNIRVVKGGRLNETRIAE